MGEPLAAPTRSVSPLFNEPGISSTEIRSRERPSRIGLKNRSRKGEQEPVSIDKEEAAPVARLIRSPEGRTVGWVYQWNTSELSILWLGAERAADQIDPPLSKEMLAAAKAVTHDAVTDLLERLSRR